MINLFLYQYVVKHIECGVFVQYFRKHLAQYCHKLCEMFKDYEGHCSINKLKVDVECFKSLYCSYICKIYHNIQYHKLTSTDDGSHDHAWTLIWALPRTRVVNHVNLKSPKQSNEYIQLWKAQSQQPLDSIDPEPVLFEMHYQSHELFNFVFVCECLSSRANPFMQQASGQ